MIALTSQEAGELRDRLREAPAAQPARETIAVSANASTSVTFTDLEKAAVLDVLTQWASDAHNETSEGLLELRSALAHDLGRGCGLPPSCAGQARSVPLEQGRHREERIELVVVASVEGGDE